MILVGLLAVSLSAGSQPMEGASRVRVTYSPFFLEQARAGNVVEITSGGTSIESTIAAPASHGESEPTTNFATAIPAFADTNALSGLFQREGVEENARPLEASRVRHRWHTPMTTPNAA